MRLLYGLACPLKMSALEMFVFKKLNNVPILAGLGRNLNVVGEEGADDAISHAIVHSRQEQGVG